MIRLWCVSVAEWQESSTCGSYVRSAFRQPPLGLLVSVVDVTTQNHRYETPSNRI